MSDHPPKPVSIATPEWNDLMFQEHATPYSGLAGMVQKQRIQKILAWAEIKPTDRVLEIGCEAGELILATPECQRRVGADISAEALKTARERAAEKNQQVEFIQADCCQPLPFQKGEFSVILCSEMLEHVPNPEACIAAIAAIAEPDTRIVLTVPYESPKIWIKKILAKLRIFHLLFPNIEEGQSEWHLQKFNKTKLIGICEPQFRILRISCVWGLHWVALCEKKL